MSEPNVQTDLVTCPICDRQVPPGEFCGACGAHLLSDRADAHGRKHAFAAHPGEHMVHLSVISTLLPHLPHRRTAPFRVALVIVLLLLATLGFLRLSGPAIAVAVLAVPVLYLVYLYEVEVYEDEPVLVVGSTLVVGIALGIPWALITGPLVTQQLLTNLTQGPSLASVVLAGIVLPLIAQALMLVGPLIVYVIRRSYDEALDGFTFGVACALGFTLSTTLIEVWPELSQGLISPTTSLTYMLDVVQRGLLVPLLNASTTGVIAGAFWLNRGELRRHMSHNLFSSIPSAIAIAAILQAALGVVNVLISNEVGVVIVYTLAVGLLLFWVRIAIHHMLLAEAVDVVIGELAPCSHCHRMVPRMAFCPHCGIATRATPKSGVGRAGRASRKGATRPG
ncbi:MAG TPA: PrsW family glutamic-type intramembrane protease [Candidatus Dormibacteraeota bacterium]